MAVANNLNIRPDYFMRYYIVDAFTDQPFRGNPAGVALLEGNTFPKEELMLKIAAELRYY